MVYDNRIKRLIFILKELNIGNSLSIVSLSHKLCVSEKIIPTIQRYMPHVKVIEPQNLKDAIEENIKKYQMT